MSDNYHPCVSTEFIIQKIKESKKIEEDSELRAGNSISFVLKGDKPFHKKFVTIREINGCINFDQAMGKAVLFGFIGELLKWLEKHKNWREGEYIT
ncbi:hypothetical protein MHTCC0001_15330 [Flavobacteriaceae bacterium MHTCC 0001]